jgi:DNA-binding response OmpR family regulator
MSAARATTAILYVEDEPFLREIAAMTFEDAGFNVVIAENGSAAFEALGDNADPFCAVITDVNLGAGPDGWAVARRARELNHILPVIYVSGASRHEWRANGVPNSVIIAKPFSATQIILVISTLLMKASPPRSR